MDSFSRPAEGVINQNAASDAPPGPIADALVLVQEAWTSLRVQQHFGRLERDWLMYARLARHFGRVVLVSAGGAEDIEIGRALAPNVSVVCNDEDLEPVRFLAAVPGRVRETLAGARSVLVKADQLCAAGTALDILSALRAADMRAGLLARGGYHWSWTQAREHGGDSPQAAQAGHDEGELCRHADVIQVTTEKIAFDLCWRFALPAAKVRVVPNFVHTPDRPTPFDERAARPERVVLSAGRLSREKRVHLLIEALSRLPSKTCETVRLKIVGSGPLEDELRASARRLNVAERVDFMGRLPHAELMREMAKCRVYAQMSEYEGHPKTILEAMAAGAPLLAADSPGIREHVADGRTGLLVSGEPAAVAERLALLLSDDALANRLGEQAAEETRRLLSLERILPMEIESCVAAVGQAGKRTPSFSPGVVRWSPSMLESPPDEAARAFAASIAAYAKRLGPDEAAKFFQSLGSHAGREADATQACG